MSMLVDCSNCRAQLHLPPGGKYIRCAFCQAVTHIICAVTPPTYSTPFFSSYCRNRHYQPPPQQYQFTISHLPPCQSPAFNGQKRAVICGILYKGSEDPLEGCINDAKCMKHLLVNKFNFPKSSIIMLTEEEKDPLKRPTKHNIRMAMHWLVKGCQQGDSLVFYFSGHGSQERDTNGDEIDGYDEGICPLDAETQGLIIDDEINARIVKPLPHGVKLHAIIDACHSGTVLDLPYLCKMYRSGKYVWEDHRPKSGVWKGTDGGEAISFSGCDDHQESVDTSALSKVTSTGAMTFSFIQAIERGHATTYGDMLTAMRSTIRRANLGAGVKQVPQLSSNEPFDVYEKVLSI